MGPLQLLDPLVRAFCDREAIDWARYGEPFLLQLTVEAQELMDDRFKLDSGFFRSVWTSARRVAGRKEFCGILNWAVRNDEPQLANALATVARGIAKHCVTVPPEPPFPPGFVCFRGGGFDDKYRSFFAKGNKFRQPAFLATSFSEQVARGFIARCTMDSKVLWRVHIDPVKKCHHVSLINKTNVPGEEEYLFVAYSAFTVLSADWRAGTTADPHVVELLAAADNRRASEGLYLAPWS